MNTPKVKIDRADYTGVLPSTAIDPDTATSNGCMTHERPDGSIVVVFVIDSLTAKRYHSRRGVMDLGRYLWENVIKRAVVDSVW